MINRSKKLTGPFLIDLKNKFRQIAGDDQLIDRVEFLNGLALSNKDISNRLFDIFDKDNSGAIDYNEFMDTIEAMVSGNKRKKIQFAFELHDLDNSGFIDRHELKVLVKQSFIDNSLDFDEYQIELLVDEFFKKADKDNSNTIDFNEFLDVANKVSDLTGCEIEEVEFPKHLRGKYQKYTCSDNVKINNFYNNSRINLELGIKKVYDNE